MKNKKMFFLSAVSFLISAFSAASITVNNRDIIPMFSYILAILFWLSTVFGFTMCAILAKRTRQKKKSVPRPLRLFKTKSLAFFDVVFFFSTIGTILCIALHSSITILWALLLFLNIFSFELHFLFSIKNKEEFQK